MANGIFQYLPSSSFLCIRQHHSNWSFIAILRRPSKKNCTVQWDWPWRLFRSTDSPLWGNRQLETCAPNDSKMTMNTTRSKVHHVCCPSTFDWPWAPNFYHFHSKACCFGYRPFWTKCSEWPQNDLAYYEVKGTPLPIYLLQVPPSPKFHSILLYTHFWVTGPIETIALNDPKRSWGLWSKRYPIHPPSPSQFLICFVLHLSIFELQLILIKVY